MIEPRKLRVFLCHASQDKLVVRELYQRLRTEGWIDPWLDEEKLLPGKDWDLEIEKAVEESDAVIVFLSTNSVSKEGYVQRELRLVLRIADFKPEGTVFVIPVRLEHCPIPHRLAMWHYVNYFPQDQKQQAYLRLLRSLNERANTLGVSPINSAEEKKETLNKDLLVNNSNDPKEKAKETQDKPSLEVLAAKKSFFENVSLKHFSIFGIVLLMLFGIIIFGKSYFMTGLVAPDTPIASDTRSSSMSLTKITTSTPSGTPSPASIKTGSTPSTSPSPTSTLGIGSTTISERDGIMLIYVPAGEFEMGNVANAVLRECHKTFTDCQLDWFSDEEPVHTVALDAYWIDQTEVTNAMYAECVNAGICNLPSSVGSYSRGSYYGNTEFDDFPVINVSWIDASAYCEWADRRLPIEAEWEKAAGWDEEKHSQRFYPWGDEFDGTVVNFCDNKCDFNWKNANYDDGHIETARVGSYPGGASFYGVYDMAGNIREWVADWYDVYPGGDKSVDDDYGKKFRVLRGGGWDTLDSLVHSTERSRNNPSDSHSNIGFRCALSASSEVSP